MLAREELAAKVAARKAAIDTMSQLGLRVVASGPRHVLFENFGVLGRVVH